MTEVAAATDAHGLVPAWYGWMESFVQAAVVQADAQVEVPWLTARVRPKRFGVSSIGGDGGGGTGRFLEGSQWCWRVPHFGKRCRRVRQVLYDVLPAVT